MSTNTAQPMKTRKLPKRRNGESLLLWLERAMHDALNLGQFVDALWLAQLIKNIRSI